VFSILASVDTYIIEKSEEFQEVIGLTLEEEQKR